VSQHQIDLWAVPPARLDSEVQAVWREVSAQLLPGVGKESDRTMFEVLVRLVAKMRAGPRGRKTGTSALRWRGRSQLWCDSQDLALHTVMSDGVATVRQTLGRGE